MKKSNCKGGTREWSDVSHNIGIGCSHGCLYCYAAKFSVDKEIVKDRADWLIERVTSRRIPTKPGLIMFPTAHDITPFYLESSLAAIEGMMKAGREVLVVTKAHLDVVKEICTRFTGYRDNIVLRITIGSVDEKTCKFWEPGAPPPSERLAALEYAHKQGFTTSVSMEPILLGVNDAVKTYEAVEPYVTELIWIGKMNDPDKRVDVSDPENRKKVNYVKVCQSDKEIRKLYDLLNDRAKVAWKDSITKVVKP